MGQVVWDIGEFFVWEDHRLVLDRSLLDGRAALDIVNVNVRKPECRCLIYCQIVETKRGILLQISDLTKLSFPSPSG